MEGSLVGVGMFAALLCVLNACAPLPDVSPFATSTRQLAAAVRVSGDAVVQLVSTEHDSQHPGEPSQSKALRESWVARDGAMLALVRYSDGLASIVGGFNEAKNNAAVLGDGVERLAQATGLIAPGGGAAAGVAVDVGKLVVELIAKVKAANSLEAALETAQPVIEAVASNLGRQVVPNRTGDGASNDVTDLIAIYRALGSNIENARVRETQPTVDLLQMLTERRSAIVVAPGGAIDDLSQLTATITHVQQELAAKNAQFDTRAKRVAEARALAESLAAAVDAWATAHADVVSAVKARRPINIESLSESVVEIRALVKRVREL